jgi:hypothetical protein
MNRVQNIPRLSQDKTRVGRTLLSAAVEDDFKLSAPQTLGGAALQRCDKPSRPQSGFSRAVSTANRKNAFCSLRVSRGEMDACLVTHPSGARIALMGDPVDSGIKSAEKTGPADDLHEAAVKSYLMVATSFLEGLLRLWNAAAAYSRLSLALLQFHSLPKGTLSGVAAGVAETLSGLDYDRYDALEYVSNVSHLVYATTLLDTFLSDTTLFLFLLNPRSMGKNQQISIQMLIDASSRADALTRAAVKRTKEIGYLAFPDRIEALRQTFGLEISISADTAEALVHYPSIRNTAVHDQGIFELALDSGGAVLARQKTCRLHPTPIASGDINKAIRSYEAVGVSIAKPVFVQVLKEPEHVFLKKVIGHLEKPAPPAERP